MAVLKLCVLAGAGLASGFQLAASSGAAASSSVGRATAPLRVQTSEEVETVVETVVEAAVVEEAVAPAPASVKPSPVRRVKNSDEWFMRALPFMDRPDFLDGTLAADAGFDPVGFVTSRVDLYNLREAEIKHARLAMLCAAGWPLAELWDDGIAKTVGLPSIVAENGGRDPSILNGGLGLISPAYWVAVVALAGAIEYHSEMRKEEAKAGDKAWMYTGSWIPGDLGFDPLGLYTALAPGDRGKFLMETAELKNGRLAMLAVLAFVVEEFASGKAVVDNTPIFFEPFWKVVEDIMIGAPAPYEQF